MAKSKKTNVERILEQNKISYTSTEYDVSDGKIDGVSVAEKLGKSVDLVYKTLVTKGQGSDLYVFVVPVSCELDLKKAARACGEKKVEMIAVKDIQKFTGYIRGGCSPVGMKKKYRTFIDAAIENKPEIIVSAGKKGVQVCLSPIDLVSITDAEFANLVHD